MATQFIVRSPGNKHAIKLKTVLYDGIELIRTHESGIAVFELSDADVEVELVMRRKKNSYPEQASKNTAAASSGILLATTAKEANDTSVLPKDSQLTAKDGPGQVKRPHEPNDQISNSPKKQKHDTSHIITNPSLTANIDITKKYRANRGHRHSAIWNTRYSELLQYRNRHGNCIVPKDYSSTLHHWIESQRKYFRDNKLSPDRIQQLNNIGFTWNAKESRWYNRYTQLMLYKGQHGHTRVPQKYEENPQLGEWVIEQRKQMRTGVIREDRIQKLNEIGFEWDGRRAVQTSNRDGNDEYRVNENTNVVDGNEDE